MKDFAKATKGNSGMRLMSKQLPVSDGMSSIGSDNCPAA